MHGQDRGEPSQLGTSSPGLSGPEVVRRDVSPTELRARLAADACVVTGGEMVEIGNLTPDELGACHFQNESGFYFLTEESDDRPPPPVKRQPREAEPMPTVAPVVEVVADAASPDLLSSIPLPDAGVPQIQALVAAPADLRGVLPAASDTNGLTVIMAGIAVLGGGAAWKFYNDHSRRKHEQAMARIEREPQQDSHQKCDASRAALELRVTDVQAKVDALNVRLDAIQQGIAELKNAPPPTLDFDTDALEERLKKLEKQAKLRKAR